MGVLTKATAALIVAGSTPAALADTTEWTGAVSDNWFAAANWDNGVPTDSDLAIILTAPVNDPTIFNASVYGTAEVNSLEVVDSGSLTLLGNAELTANEVFIGIGSGDDATVLVAGAIMDVQGALTLGQDNSSKGTLIVSENATVTIDGGIKLQTDGSSVVIGGLTTPDSPGTLTLPNAGVIESKVGGQILFNHTGTETDGYAFTPGITGLIDLNVTSGYTTVTGDASGVTGNVVVDGGTLAIANKLGGAELIVGNTNTGTDAVFAVGDGGVAAITGDVIVGNASGSSGAIVLSGSGSLTASSDFIIANKGGSTGVLAFGAADGDAAAAAGALSAESIKFGSGTGTLLFNHTSSSSDPFAFAIPIGGKGTILAEAGYTELTTENTSFSGTVTVNGGTLEITEDMNAETLTVGDDGTDSDLLVSDTATLRISGSTVVGNQTGSSGKVIVSGSTTSGSSVDPSSLWSKALTVGENGTGVLVVSDGGYIDVNSGNSSLTIASAAGSTGTFAIGAASGETPAGTGTIKTKQIAFGDGTGTLLFNHSDTTGTFVFDHKIIGPGAIVSENGYTSLKGNLDGFSGTTTVKDGSLSVDTTLPGEVTVNGGTLLGTGTLTDIAFIKSGGTLAPGNSVGTLKAADVTFAAGSTFAVEIDSDGNADLLEASGTVEIDGGTVDVAADAYLYDETVTIISADDISGTFDTVTGATAFIDYSLNYGADGSAEIVELIQVVSQSFSSIAPTPNTKAVATGLDSLVETNVTHEIVQALLGSATEEEALAVFDQLTGEGHPSLKGALMENSQQVVQTVNDRFRTAFGDDRGGSTIMAYAGGGKDITPEGWSGSVWIAPYGDWLDTDGNRNTAAMDSDVGGVLAGLDGWVSDHVRLGILGGYARTTVSVDDRAFDGSADSGTVGIYGGYQDGAALINAGAVYGWYGIDTRRRITAPVDQTLKADYDARSWQLFAEASYAFDMPSATITPFGGVSYVNLHTDSFTETGGSAALAAKSDTSQTTFTTLGLRSSVPLSRSVQAHGMAGWRHAFGDIDPTTVFTLDASDPFTITGAPIAENALVVEAGLDAALSGSVTGGVSYQGQVGDGVEAHGGVARLAARF
ncbi:autotransporter outer membrane beta-barrel domain-containing protein [Bauldia sp.]|uniref:autotransporter outer membrane beta-barrel domain-containing protein n=1 Tax=Bauldia sp. TaxID=2575872 RepID=UPI003BA960D9